MNSGVDDNASEIVCEILTLLEGEITKIRKVVSHFDLVNYK